LQVGRRFLVQDHEIDREPLHAPVLVRAQELPDDLAVLDLVDPDQHDRQISRDSMRPQGRGPEGVAREDRRRRAQPRIGIEDPVGDLLEEVGFFRRDAQVMELNLCLGPRECRDALEPRRIAILVGHAEHGGACVGEHRGEHDAAALPGREPQAAPQTEDRVEHEARRVGERPAFDHRHRRADAAAASQEAPTLRLVLRAAGAGALDGDDVGGPDARLVR
jgi:hypothetical protein